MSKSYLLFRHSRGPFRFHFFFCQLNCPYDGHELRLVDTGCEPPRDTWKSLTVFRTHDQLHGVNKCRSHRDIGESDLVAHLGKITNKGPTSIRGRSGENLHADRNHLMNLPYQVCLLKQGLLKSTQGDLEVFLRLFNRRVVVWHVPDNRVEPYRGGKFKLMRAEIDP